MLGELQAQGFEVHVLTKGPVAAPDGSNLEQVREALARIRERAESP